MQSLPIRPEAKPAILQIVPKLETGGAERTTIDIARALVAAGFAAPVISEGGRMVDELRAAGGEPIALPAASKSPLTILANARRIEQIIAEKNVKLVHARSRAPAWSGLIAARRAGVPFLATYHGNYSATNPLKGWYNSVMVRGAAVIANSQWTAAHIAAEYGDRPKRVVVIPRGIDTDHFDLAGVRPERVAALRRDWGVEDGDTVVLLPGRLTRWKGQLVLVEALAQMKARAGIAKLKAVLAGDAQGRDAYADELRAAIAAHGLDGAVHIAGHVSDMAAAYLACDIAVSASTQPESFGRTPVEAGAMGRPTIATALGGARETVLPGQSGLLIPPGDADSNGRRPRRVAGHGRGRPPRHGRAGPGPCAGPIYARDHVRGDAGALSRAHGRLTVPQAGFRC